MIDPRVGEALLVFQLLALTVIRVPFAKAAGHVPVAHSLKGPLERALMVLVTIGSIVLPILVITTPLLSFADYGLRPGAAAAGVVALALAIWLGYRSHADLGLNWSVTLELKESHSLVTDGVYRALRHPMYAGIFVAALSQALLLANWVAGPAFLVTFGVMALARIGREERMLREQFGRAYEQYSARTKRLVPGLL